MSRDSNGNYTLPVGNPVITDTTIESDWANSTMGDVGSEVTNSLDRQGRGGMLAPLKGTDGTAGLPAFSYTNEFNSGWYRASAGQHNFSILGTDVFKLTQGTDISFGAGTFSITGGSFSVISGTYLFDGVGLELDGTDLFIGDSATGQQVLTDQNLTAALVPFDNTITGVLSATNVQDAIDILSVGAQTYSSIPYTGGGTLVAGVMNELLDGSLYDLPPASSTQVNAQLGISLPSTAKGFRPFVVADGADLITWEKGTDNNMRFSAPATIWITSNGVDTWRY